MIAYIDSSVLLRILLDEEGKLEEFKKIELGISSVLLKIECLRTLDRLRFENQYNDDEYMESRSLFLSAFKKISFIKLSNSIVESSCRPWGVPVKSLDSIHLASALQWKQSEEKNLVFLTHDRRLGNVAKSNGLDVSGI
jgi:predicted nucleic acid-binding protein